MQKEQLIWWLVSLPLLVAGFLWVIVLVYAFIYFSKRGR